MEPKEIYRWLHNEPFVPFRISMSNGRTYDVYKPEYGFLTKTLFYLGEPDPDFPIPITESAEHISLIHINSVQLLSAAKAPAVA